MCSAIFAMDKNIEQRICLKFCMFEQNFVCRIAENVAAYAKCALSKARVYKWNETFAEVREVVGVLPRPGRPSTSSTDENVAKVKEMVLENHH